MLSMAPAPPVEVLRSLFGERLQEQVPLAPFTSARIGGPAEWLLEVKSSAELADAALRLWSLRSPFFVLGGGSNLLVSDLGIKGLVLHNRARGLRYEADAEPSVVWAESGVNFGVLARQAAQKGLSGLEWAAGIPGTLGGAVFGNAGAHGSEVAANLRMAEILHPKLGRVQWSADDMQYQYRSSVLKLERSPALILSAELQLARAPLEAIRAKMDEFLAYRRKTQPPGASMGSMFKNPPGDYAGRLIEAVGLKGLQVGAAQISPLHGNFFLNLGGATASDVRALIEQARAAVKKKFEVELELEIELVGAW